MHIPARFAIMDNAAAAAAAATSELRFYTF
jgi:hypothetical protein